jgi:stage III sporulation protein AB
MLRFLLCIIIIALCGYIGRLKSNKIKMRHSCIIEINEIMYCLEADMKNEMLTLAQSLMREAANAKIFKNMLATCAKRIKEYPGQPFHQIWDDAFYKELELNSTLASLSKEETALIKKTGRSLVNASIQTQDTHFKMLFQEFETMGEKIKLEAGKKIKLYNSLGLMAGFFIAILLI